MPPTPSPTGSPLCPAWPKSVIGGNEREVWVELNRDALARNLTTADITARARRHFEPARRAIRDAGNEFNAALTPNISRWGHRQLKWPAAAARRRLADLGTVRPHAEIRQRAILDGKRGVLLKVVKKARQHRFRGERIAQTF